MSVPIEKLFSNNRFPFGFSLLFLIVYTPIGVILAVLRLFISLQLLLASKILPTGSAACKLVIRTLYCVMGVFVVEVNSEEKADSCPIVVSNHVTPFDHIAISLAFPCITVNSSNLPETLSLFLNFPIFGRSQNRATILSKIDSYLRKPDALPLLIFPERATTNGAVSLMSYNSLGLDVDKPVLGIGLKVWRLPVLSIEPSVLGSSWLTDLFFLFFSPITVYSIRRVGKFTKTSEDSADEFALRIQKTTAEALRLQSSEHTYSDKAEYIKKLIREQAMLSNPFYSPEVHSMAVQVREVLPHLPLDIIKRDIVRTRNVDLTITNFLEGNIQEPIPSPSTPSVPSSPSRDSASSATSSPRPIVGANPILDQSVLASSFGKTSLERAQSLEMRRALLVERARKRYFEVYGRVEGETEC